MNNTQKYLRINFKGQKGTLKFLPETEEDQLKVELSICMNKKEHPYNVYKELYELEILELNGNELKTIEQIPFKDLKI